MRLNKYLLLKLTLTIISIMIIGYLCISLFVHIRLSNVKQEVLDHNPEITSIQSIDRLGHWGEFFREYVLVVQKGTDTKYRIWSSEDGKITDEEIINE